MIATASPRQSSLVDRARTDTTDIVRVQIGDTSFALPLSAIATILSPLAMTTSDDPSWAGTVPSRGGQIPIASGRTIFGLTGHESNQQRLLVLRGAPATGLMVDAIHGTTTVATGDIAWLSPLFGPVEQLLVQSVAWGHDGTLDLIIDVPALRRHLHGDARFATSNATDAIAAQFADTPTGDRLELQIDDSDRRYQLPISYVRHISDPRPPAHLPRTSDTILGLLAWRRDPIPLIDTARALGLPPSEPTTLIVVGPDPRPDEALFALTIANVAGVAQHDATSALLDLGEIVRRLV